MIKILFYRLSVVALFVLVMSTIIMIVAIFDVSFSERALEYIMLWGVVAVACIASIVPHLFHMYEGGK